MSRRFKVQRSLMCLSLLVSAALFVNALYFMTDYKGLFGLELPMNEAIAVFHDDLMQGFNQFLLYASLYGLAIVGVAFLLECFTKVPDTFAMLVMLLLFAGSAACSGYAIARALELQEVYLNLDFTFLLLEAGDEHIVTLGAFTSTLVLSAVNILTALSAGYACAASHFAYGRSAVYASV